MSSSLNLGPFPCTVHPVILTRVRFKFKHRTVIVHDDALLRYLTHIDAGANGDAIAQMEPDVAFLLVLPAGPVRGTGRDACRAYLDGRTPVRREHRVLRHQRTRDVSFVYGAVSDAGEFRGCFLAAARLSAAGLIAR